MTYQPSPPTMKLPSLRAYHATTTTKQSPQLDIELGELESPAVPSGTRIVIPHQGTPIFLGSCDILFSILPINEGNKGIDWLAIGRPSEKFEVGMNLFGVRRIEGVMDRDFRGHVDRVVKYERGHVVYGVRIGGGTVVYTVRVKYRHSRVGFWKRLRVFVWEWKDPYWDWKEEKGRAVKDRGVRAWGEYIWGPGFYFGK